MEQLDQAIYAAMSAEIGKLMIDKIAVTTELQLTKAKLAQVQAQPDNAKTEDTKPAE